MEQDLGDEWRDLAEHEEAIQATCRIHRRLGRNQQPPQSGPARGAGRSRGPRAGSLPTKPPSEAKPVDSEAYLRVWQIHDEAWSRFQDGPPRPVSMGSVPWPPCNSDVLEFCERLQAPGQRKHAYQIACRRWHPDKFLQHYGMMVVPEDVEAVKAKLTDVFQSIAAQWELGCRQSASLSRGR